MGVAGAYGSSLTGQRHSDVLRLTRGIAVGIVVVLLLAFGILYLAPERTDALFAWTIAPTMTSLVMGAGYLGGAWFFTRVALARRWHEVEAALPGIWGFTVVMAAATLLHLDRFHHGHPAFFLWIALYLSLPFVLPALYVLNARAAAPDASTGPAVERTDVPRVAQTVALAGGVAAILLGAALFLLPDALAAIWPWELTTLTARVLGGWYVLAGGLALVLAWRPGWAAWRLPVQSQIIGLTFVLIGIARAWPEFDAALVTTWLYVGGSAGVLMALVALTLAMERPSRRLHGIG